MLYCVMQSCMFTWMRILPTFFVGHVSWVLANICDSVFSFLWRWKRNSECRCLQNGLPEIFGRLLYAYLCTPIFEDHQEWWSFITAICDEGDQMTICEQHKEGYDCTYSFCLTSKCLLLYAYLHDCWELMKSMVSHGSGHSIAIHDQGDGLILCGKSHKVIVCTHSFCVTSKCCSGVLFVISWI
jgi:hypothetical protein